MNIFLKEYLSILKFEKNLSENTIQSYRNDLSSFIKFLEKYNVSDPSEIKQKHLSEFFKSLKDIGLSSRSASRYHSTIKGFFKYL